jgi:endonuclease III
MNPEDIILLFEHFKKDNARPESELYYTNAYTLLVAVVLSAQATDKGVNKATKDLFDKVATPQDMLELGEEGLRTHIKTIGLYPTKARHIMALSRDLITLHKGQVPQTREALMGLDGVGRKTANVVLSVAFGQPALAVDTHIYRVARRLGLSRGTTPLAVELDLLALIPDQYLTHAHHWLILHGRYICKARSPLCAACPIQALCPFGRDILSK